MMLQGKSVLVTGAASGIGRETALLCAREGASHVACLDVHEGNARATAAEVEALGAKALPVVVDLADVDQIRSAFAEVVAAFPRLDAAFHIGGYSWRGETLDVTVEEWDKFIDTNLRSAFFCCQEALKIMYPQGSGAIVNMSADAVFYPIYGFAVQAAGKGAIVHMTKTLALEAAPRGVRVNVVSPGIVHTQVQGAPRPEGPPLRREPPPTLDLPGGIAGKTAIGRFMTMEEQAQVFVFLASDRASGVNGDLVSVNGGGYPSLDY